MDTFQVLIVGAGPVGLTCAFELLRRGISCRIIDRQLYPSEHSRALAIMPRTLELFEDVGIIAPFLTQGKALRSIMFHIDGKDVSLSTDYLETPYPYLLCLPENSTEEILNERLAAFHTTVERGVELTGIQLREDHVEVTLKRGDQIEQTQATFVIGCDGAKSSVRNLLGIPFEGDVCPQIFGLADMEVEWAYGYESPQIFLSDAGLAIFFPLPNGLHRLILPDLPAPQESDRLSQGESLILSLEELQKEVDKRCPVKIVLKNPAWSSEFRISYRKAASYQKGFVFLAGDAAHVHSPAGGQGMNMGIQDAYNLCWKLAMVIKQKAPESLLASYQEEREKVARRTLAMTNWVTSGMTSQGAISQWFKKKILPSLLSSSFIQKKILGALSQLQVNYRESSIVKEDLAASSFHAGPHPGDRAPDAQGVGLEKSGSKRLYELIVGKEFVLLLFSGYNPTLEQMNQIKKITQRVKEQWGDLITTFLVVGTDEITPEGTLPPLLYDRYLNLHKQWDGGQPSLYLIRPDRYIAYRAKLSSSADLLEYLNQNFAPSKERRGHPEGAGEEVHAEVDAEISV